MGPLLIISNLQDLKKRLFTFRGFLKVLMNLLQAKMTLRQVILKMVYSLLVNCRQVKMKFLLRKQSVTLVLRMGRNVESLREVAKEELGIM